jgi:hypothetical protein
MTKVEKKQLDETLEMLRDRYREATCPTVRANLVDIALKLKKMAA